jgi:hypothetical protein
MRDVNKNIALLAFIFGLFCVSIAIQLLGLFS